MKKKIIVNRKKVKIHWTHLLALLILASYFVLSKFNTLQALSVNNIIESFLRIYFFGIFFACLFLFLFSHDKFFPVAKEIQKVEIKKEKKYLNKYVHHGKILSTFIIGVIGGPVFSSLTARLLLNNHWYKYLIVILANIPSTFVTTGLAKTFVGLF